MTYGLPFRLAITAYECQLHYKYNNIKNMMTPRATIYVIKIEGLIMCVVAKRICKHKADQVNQLTA